MVFSPPWNPTVMDLRVSVPLWKDNTRTEALFCTLENDNSSSVFVFIGSTGEKSMSPQAMSSPFTWTMDKLPFQLLLWTVNCIFVRTTFYPNFFEDNIDVYMIFHYLWPLAFFGSGAVPADAGWRQGTCTPWTVRQTIATLMNIRQTDALTFPRLLWGDSAHCYTTVQPLLMINLTAQVPEVIK